MATARRGALGRRDSNEGELVRLLREVPGVVVVQLNSPADLLIGYCGVNLLVEVKDQAKVPSKRRLTEQEAAFHLAWTGQICIAECWEDLELLLQRVKRLATLRAD